LTKDYRVLVFSGREHHVQRLDSVMRALRSRNVRVDLVTSDNSVGIDTHTGHLIQSGREFLHVLDYINSQDIPGITAATWDALVSILDAENDIRESVDPFWLAQVIREVSELLVGFDKMLRHEKPDAVCILHSANLFCHVLAYCAEHGALVDALKRRLAR